MPTDGGHDGALLPRDGGWDAAVTAPDAGPAVHPVSQYCGDAIRDPVLEECDDGPGEARDFCTSDCRVRGATLLPATDTVDAGIPTDAGTPTAFQRKLGSGVHVASASDAGFAIVYTRIDETTHVRLARFDEHGHRLGTPIDVAAEAEPAISPAPVVAALPGDAYAVAWNDRGSGTPDVALARVGSSGSIDGSIDSLHAAPTGPQQDADLLFVDDRLIAAWTDGFDLRWQAFDAGLHPLGEEQALAETTALESSVSLARFENSWAAAWRSLDDAEGLERIYVRAGGERFFTPLASPGPGDDRPVLATLDESHLLLVFTVGTDPKQSGVSNVGRLRAAVVDTEMPGPVTTLPLMALKSPYATDPTLSQRRPSLAHVQGRIYLSWETESPRDDPRGREVFLQHLQWERDEPDTLTQLDEQPLQIDAPRTSDQRNPRLAASPLFPQGALITLWEDHSGVPATPAHPDIMMGLRPSPFVTLPVEELRQ